MDLKDGHQGGLEVVRLRLLGVEDLDGVLPALQVQHRRLVEVLREEVHIHGG